MEKFNEIRCEELTDNPFKLVGSDWMLITAGTPDAFNLMTAAWEGWVYSGRGVSHSALYGRHVTHTASWRSPTASRSLFLPMSTGTCSTFAAPGQVRMWTRLPKRASRLFLRTLRLLRSGTLCSSAGTLRTGLMPDAFLDPRINDLYPLKDYHRMYVGEILKSLRRQRRPEV